MPHLNLPRFTFINGPKEVGKNLLATHLWQNNPTGVYLESFAQPIRDALIATFWPEEALNGGLDLTLSEVKKREMPFPKVHGFKGINTVRDAMISFSEDWMKPRWGSEIFVKLALKRCQENVQFYSHFVFSDCGFADELAPIIREAGPDSCLIITLDRPGHTFAGDSRNYVTFPGVRNVNLLNAGTPADLFASAELLLGNI